ncbi:hypothetical protein HZA98_02625 [Candidatus Woesearchaeota archaeon]|nr:hypothetical protein [Candidatus Woesearchaeota archaeon]
MESLEKKVVGAFTLVSLSGCFSGPHYDSSPVADVIISPFAPTVDDTLHCRVDGYADERAMFDFYWSVNEKLVFEYIDSESTLPDIYSGSGDYVECKAQQMSSNCSFGKFIGGDGVYIK